MRKLCFIGISEHGVGLKNEAQPNYFFTRPRGVWIPDETIFRVFDIASQTSNISRRISK